MLIWSHKLPLSALYKLSHLIPVTTLRFVLHCILASQMSKPRPGNLITELVSGKVQWIAKRKGLPAVVFCLFVLCIFHISVIASHRERRWVCTHWIALAPGKGLPWGWDLSWHLKTESGKRSPEERKGTDSSTNIASGTLTEVAGKLFAWRCGGSGEQRVLKVEYWENWRVRALGGSPRRLVLSYYQCNVAGGSWVWTLKSPRNNLGCSRLSVHYFKCCKWQRKVGWTVDRGECAEWEGDRKPSPSRGHKAILIHSDRHAVIVITICPSLKLAVAFAKNKLYRSL